MATRRSYSADDISSVDMGKGDYNCPHCDKSYVRKRNLQAHMKMKHDSSSSSPRRKRRCYSKETVESTPESSGTDTTTTSDSTPSTESFSSVSASSYTESDEEELSDYVWRSLMKQVLRDWAADGCHHPMPEDHTDLLPNGGKYEQFNYDLYEKVTDIISSYRELERSPIYHNIENMMQVVDQNYKGGVKNFDFNTFQSAYEIVKPLIQLCKDNNDIVERYEYDSSSGDSSDDEQ